MAKGTVDYITMQAAKKLAGHMFPKLKLGFMAVGTHEGRSYRVGYVVPQGYYVEWDITEFDDSPPERLEKKKIPVYRRVIDSDYSLKEQMDIIRRGGDFEPVLMNPRSFDVSEAVDATANPKGQKWTKIYNRVIKIYASKAGMPHRCDAGCKKAGHNYVHKFSKKACIFGLPDGSILIK